MEETLRTSFKEKEHKDALREVLRRAIDEQRRLNGDPAGGASALLEPRYAVLSAEPSKLPGLPSMRKRGDVDTLDDGRALERLFSDDPDPEI
jgi:hypothetical protein